MLQPWPRNSISANAAYGEQSNEASFCRRLELADLQGGFPQTLPVLSKAFVNKGRTPEIVGIRQND